MSETFLMLKYFLTTDTLWGGCFAILISLNNQNQTGEGITMAYHREQSSEINLTDHARTRMSSRGIREWQIEQVLLYGRQSHVRNSTVYAIGRKEIKEFGKFLAPCEGIHVLCSSDNAAIITTYRNHDMRGLKEIW